MTIPHLPASSPILDLQGTGTPKVPPALSTGCFTLPDRDPGVLSCQGRVTHAALNKDRGLIDPNTGATSDPTTSRGRVKANFAKAVAGAIVETRRQWHDMREAILGQYGPERGPVIICAVTHDDAVKDC